MGKRDMYRGPGAEDLLVGSMHKQRDVCLRGRLCCPHNNCGSKDTMSTLK